MSFSFGATAAQQKPSFSFGQPQQQQATVPPAFGQAQATGSFGNAGGGTTAAGQSQPPSFSVGASTGGNLSKPDESKKNTFSFGASSTTATTGGTTRLVDVDICNTI